MCIFRRLRFRLQHPHVGRCSSQLSLLQIQRTQHLWPLGTRQSINKKHHTHKIIKYNKRKEDNRILSTLQSEEKFGFKNMYWGLERCPSSEECSFRRLRFRSQHSHKLAYNLLELQLQEYLTSFCGVASTRLHAHGIYSHKHRYVYKLKNNLNIYKKQEIF